MGESLITDSGNPSQGRYRVVSPPPEIFQFSPSWVPSNTTTYLFDISKGRDGIVLPEEGGIEVYIVGERYPRKGYPFPPILKAIEINKRILMATMDFLFSKPIRYFVVLLMLLPRNIFDEIVLCGVEAFNFLSSRIIGTYYLKPERFCKSGRELYRVGMITADHELNKRKSIAIFRFALNLCMIWEFDSVYRYWGQDVGGEMDPEEFRKNPGKEIIRAFDKLVSRAKGEYIKEKWKKFKWVIVILSKLKGKWLNEILFETSQRINIKEIALDKGDIEQCIPKRVNYDYQGLEARLK